MLGPLLGPLSRGGTYISDTVRLSVNDLLSGKCDPQTMREILAENPEFRRAVSELLENDQQRRLGAYELWMGQYRQQIDSLTQARQSLGEDFPCMLIPARVIGGSASPYGGSLMLSTESRVGEGALVTSRELMTSRPTALPDKLAALVGSMLAGRIEQSGAWTARLTLLIDPSFEIQAAVVRMVSEDNPSREVTVFEPAGPDGRSVPVRRKLQVGDPPIYLNLRGDGKQLVSAATPAYHAIEPGDRVYTLGDDPLLPMGVEIGVVASVEPVGENPKHVYIYVTPSLDLESLRDVQIVAPLAGSRADARGAGR